MAAVPLVAEIHFQTPLKPGQMDSAPYNPFIYPNRYAGRGMEVHLVDHAPTDKADPKYFATYDDTTNISKGRSYRTTDNQPWALDVPENWLYPAEWNNIANAYLSFSSWAASEKMAEQLAVSKTTLSLYLRYRNVDIGIMTHFHSTIFGMGGGSQYSSFDGTVLF
jgi:LruC domain-containing protein